MPRRIALFAGESRFCTTSSVLRGPGMISRWLGIAIVVGAIVAVSVLRHLVSADSILLLLVLVPSVIVHEVSHGYLAHMFGDDTAKRAGRLTLNPLAHVDLFGSIILPALLIFAGVTPIGYAKPVPVDVSRLRSPRNQSVLVSLVGPAVNISLAVIAGTFLHLRLGATALQAGYGSGQFLGSSVGNLILFYLGAVNMLLGIFNLIPIPPLDGSAVIERLIPNHWLGGYFRLRRVMLPVALVVFLLFPGAMQAVFSPVIGLWVKVFVS